jgi:DNA-binding NarL/FixJ family response regulator
MGEAQPRLGVARETPKKQRRTSAQDDNVLKKVCRSLEAAGLSVVVIVALDATPALAPTGHTLRRIRRSLETTGMSVVVDTATEVGEIGSSRSGKANLALVRDDTNSSGSGGRQVALGGASEGPVIVLTTAVDEAAARAAFVTGGLGYVVKVSDTVSAATSSTLVARSGERRRSPAPALPSTDSSSAVVLGHGLTSRELEVLRALATGASTVEVARELYVSPKTAKNHIAHIYAKLGVCSRTQAVAKALRQGIVKID